MIGHKMNGGYVLMALPADDDYFVVLHVRIPLVGSPEYATGLVHVRQLPTPREWWSGHYFHDDRIGAIVDLLKRSVLDTPTDVMLYRFNDLVKRTEARLTTRLEHVCDQRTDGAGPEYQVERSRCPACLHW